MSPKYSSREFFIWLNTISDSERQLLAIEHELKEVMDDMKAKGEAVYISSPSLMYSDITKVIPENPRLRYFSELLFVKKSLEKS